MTVADNVSLLVWDIDEKLPSEHDAVVLWRSYSVTDVDTEVSISQLVEDNADHLRAGYLALIYELGEAKVGGKRVVDHLEIRAGFSYWWMTLLVEKCNFAKSPQIDNVIKLMAFKDWFATKNYSSISLVSPNKELAAAMQLLVAACDGRFVWNRVTQKKNTTDSFLKNIYDKLPNAIQALVWLSRYLISHWPLKGVGVDEWENTNSKTLFVSYSDNLYSDTRAKGGVYSRYWYHLPDVIERNNSSTSWLHIYVPDSFLPTAKIAAEKFTEINYQAQGKQVHVTLSSFIDYRCILTTVCDWLRVKRIGFHLESDVSIICGIYWPLLKDDYCGSFYGATAVGNFLYYRLLDKAMKLLPEHNNALYLQENMAWEYGFSQIWRHSQHNFLIGVPHSTVRYWDMRYFFDARSYGNGNGSNLRQSENTKLALPLPDSMAINGDVAMKQCLEGNLPNYLLQPVEALRYLHLTNQRESAAPSIESVNIRPTILVLGDYVKANTLDLLQLISQSKEYLGGRFELIIKFHPNCLINLPEMPGVSHAVSDKPITDLLSVSNIAFTSSTTSAAVDAYCYGLPVISILDPTTLNLSPLRGVNGVSFVGTSKELCTTLDKIQKNGIDHRTREEFFYLDPELPRWKKLLGI